MSEFHPLPKLGNHSIYVWGGLLGVALLGYMWYSHRSSAANTASTTTTTDPTLGSGALGSNSGAVNNSGATDTSTTDSSTTDSNQSWETRAVSYLVSLGVGGESAQQLIEQYLSGYKTSYQGHLRLNQVIAHLGPPPEGTDAIPGWNPPPKHGPAKGSAKHPSKKTNHKVKKRHKIKPKPKRKERRKIRRSGVTKAGKR